MGLRNSAIKGVAWSSIGTIGSGLVSFVITMVLARILAPADYGILELLLIFTILSEVFIDSGFSQALIKDQKASETDNSTVFYFNLLAAFVLYTVLWFLSPTISQFYSIPELVALSRFVFITIIFFSASIIQTAILSKQMDFKTQAIASITSIVFSGVVAICLAFCGFGVWALAWNFVLNSAVRCIALWLISPWKPSFCFSIRSLKKYYSFGINLLIQGAVDKFVSNMESLLIGKVYSRVELGYFSQARNLDSYIGRTTTNVIKQVSYPLLAKVDTSVLKEGYRKVLTTSMVAFLPISLFLVSSSEIFLYCVFGAQWIPSAPYLRLWCICGLLVSFYSVFINIYLVKGETKKLLYLSLIRQIIRVIIIVVFIRISVIALMWAILATTFISAALYVFWGCKLIKYRFTELSRDLFPIIVSSSLSALMVFCIPYLIYFSSNYLLLGIQFLVMLLFYSFFSFILKSSSFIEIINLLKVNCFSFFKAFKK